MTTKIRVALPLLLVVTLIVGMLIGGQASADDDEWLAFDGTMDGQFVVGPGNAPGTFSVRTIALGDSTLGPLSYAAFALQDLSEVPPGCGEDSSIGAGGYASLILADGSLQLKRKRGDACFEPPAITVYETYRVVGGTGLYKGAKGYMSAELDGEVIGYTISIDFTGIIEFDDYQDDDSDSD